MNARTRQRLAVVGVVAVGAPSLMSTPASAIIAPSYGPIWRYNTTLGTTNKPVVRFTPSVPTGDFRNRVVDGVRQWNWVGEPLVYSVAPTDGVNHDPFTTCYRKSEVSIHVTPIDGGRGTLGRSAYCATSSGGVTARYSAWIQFDSAEAWCLGAGDCYDGVLGVGANVDLWSVASHEMGHVSALDHFPEDDGVCADDSSRATMCPSIKAGSEDQRTLAAPDSDSLRFWY